MKYFVIGGSGSIGATLVPAAIAAGHEVVALGRSAAARDRLEELGARPISGDMTDPVGWITVAAEADVLVHLGATATKRSSGRWLRQGGRANRTATRGLVEAAVRGGNCQSLITASGVMVAGDHGDNWIDETTPDNDHPLTAYWGPNEIELVNARSAGVSATALRFGQVYDPSPDSTFGRFFLSAATNGKFRYIGDGRNYFPFVHVTDAVDAILRTARQRPTEEKFYIVEDDVQPMATSVGALMGAFGHAGKGVPLAVGRLAAGKPMAAGFSGSYRTRNDLAREVLGWEPSRPSFRHAITEVAERYLAMTNRSRPQ